MFHIVLFEPRIPQNTGNIIRLVANNNCYLHLIEPLGFDLAEKNLRRSGLDYLDMANVQTHADYASFIDCLKPERLFAITTKGKRYYHQVSYQAGDVFLFGSETSGLPASIQGNIASDHQLRIPMHENNRSMNLSNTVAIISYEAWRQRDFEGGQ